MPTEQKGVSKCQFNPKVVSNCSITARRARRLAAGKSKWRKDVLELRSDAMEGFRNEVIKKCNSLLQAK